jgi:hypothetical protein
LAARSPPALIGINRRSETRREPSARQRIAVPIE